MKDIKDLIEGEEEDEIINKYVDDYVDVIKENNMTFTTFSVHYVASLKGFVDKKGLHMIKVFIAVVQKAFNS